MRLALGVCVVASSLGSLVGCDGPKSGRAAPLGSEAPLPVIEVSARRPSVRFVMERTSDRCEVYWVDGSESSPHADAPCPEEMLLGEKLRLTGMTCMREGASQDRKIPVVCPDPLTNLEKAYRKSHSPK